jgi:uncharacterized protein with PIN domain
LTGLALDIEIFREAQQQRLILITKDTDFIRQFQYTIGHDGIFFVTQSRTELQDTVIAIASLADSDTTIAHRRFIILIGGQTREVQ